MIPILIFIVTLTAILALAAILTLKLIRILTGESEQETGYLQPLNLSAAHSWHMTASGGKWGMNAISCDNTTSDYFT